MTSNDMTNAGAIFNADAIYISTYAALSLNLFLLRNGGYASSAHSCQIRITENAYDSMYPFGMLPSHHTNMFRITWNRGIGLSSADTVATTAYCECSTLEGGVGTVVVICPKTSFAPKWTWLSWLVLVFHKSAFIESVLGCGLLLYLPDIWLSELYCLLLKQDLLSFAGLCLDEVVPHFQRQQLYHMRQHPPHPWSGQHSHRLASWDSLPSWGNIKQNMNTTCGTPTHCLKLGDEPLGFCLFNLLTELNSFTWSIHADCWPFNAVDYDLAEGGPPRQLGIDRTAAVTASEAGRRLARCLLLTGWSGIVGCLFSLVSEAASRGRCTAWAPRLARLLAGLGSGPISSGAGPVAGTSTGTGARRKDTNATDLAVQAGQGQSAGLRLGITRNSPHELTSLHDEAA
ncbi:unnamed protein product [Protopolystoma xenopodis]|uniref:Uncharacterized protein n=1 Tax=Protopolystoma xenopodis TaxID=117903 RepID=A0A448XEI5_9PLAT|nr:unnamed protein product [Protopolystoma xenopodis]